jgi:putative membrane protein
MTYWLFLFLFLIIPIVIFFVIALFDHHRGFALPAKFTSMPYWTAVALHMLIAPTYTFLWDNYLVANRIWWYKESLVSGIILWWVPLEEYVFFVLQPLLGGLVLLFILRRIKYYVDGSPDYASWRKTPLLLIILLWSLSLVGFLSSEPALRYGSLEILWALPPIALQVAFGGDILRKNWAIVVLNISFLTAYLSIADSFAIWNGTWTIDPTQSLDLLIGKILPLEELLFFFLTNTLITFGILLFISREGRERIHKIVISINPLIQQTQSE